MRGARLETKAGADYSRRQLVLTGSVPAQRNASARPTVTNVQALSLPVWTACVSSSPRTVRHLVRPSNSTQTSHSTWRIAIVWYRITPNSRTANTMPTMAGFEIGRPMGPSRREQVRLPISAACPPCYYCAGRRAPRMPCISNVAKPRILSMILSTDLSTISSNRILCCGGRRNPDASTAAQSPERKVPGRRSRRASEPNPSLSARAEENFRSYPHPPGR